MEPRGCSWGAYGPSWVPMRSPWLLAMGHHAAPMLAHRVPMGSLWYPCGIAMGYPRGSLVGPHGFTMGTHEIRVGPHDCPWGSHGSAWGRMGPAWIPMGPRGPPMGSQRVNAPLPPLGSHGFPCVPMMGPHGSTWGPQGIPRGTACRAHGHPDDAPHVIICSYYRLVSVVILTRSTLRRLLFCRVVFVI